MPWIKGSEYISLSIYVPIEVAYSHWSHVKERRDDIWALILSSISALEMGALGGNSIGSFRAKVWVIE